MEVKIAVRLGQLSASWWQSFSRGHVTAISIICYCTSIGLALSPTHSDTGSYSWPTHATWQGSSLLLFSPRQGQTATRCNIGVEGKFTGYLYRVQVRYIGFSEIPYSTSNSCRLHNNRIPTERRKRERSATKRRDPVLRRSVGLNRVADPVERTCLRWSVATRRANGPPF